MDDKFDKKNAFLKNKAGELLKTKDIAKKQTGNKAKTKRENLLETIEGPEKQSENKPENKAGHVVENKDAAKTDRKQTEDRTRDLEGSLQTGFIAAFGEIPLKALPHAKAQRRKARTARSAWRSGTITAAHAGKVVTMAGTESIFFRE